MAPRESQEEICALHLHALHLQREEMPRQSDLNGCLDQFKPVHQPNREFINEYLIIEFFLFFFISFQYKTAKVKKVTSQLE